MVQTWFAGLSKPPDEGCCQAMIESAKPLSIGRLQHYEKIERRLEFLFIDE